MPVALITGASKGLGLALARSLAYDGWTLVLDARGVAALDVAHAELAAVTEVHALAGDVTDPAHRQALAATIERLGRLDLLVNNASTLGPTPLPHLAHHPLDGLRATYEVNVVAPLALIQRLLPLVKGSNGAVINVTSDAAVEGYEGWGGYGSSKAALEQLSNVLAAEEPELRVWWIDPGDMRTQMHQDAFPGEDISDRPEPESVVPALREVIAQRPPSGRVRAADLLVAQP
jgi:NAD(P)-dependent dehydrogenase (short-subunit alcohol dehydrogenase family)